MEEEYQVIVRGSTETIEIDVEDSIDLSQVDIISFTLKQFGEAVVDKKTEEVSVSGSVISVWLSQEDTFKLSTEDYVKIGLRFKLGNQVIPTEIGELMVGEAINEEVL